MTPASLDVLAIGNAIVDVLSHCDDSLLTEVALPKGSMTLVEGERATEIYEATGPGMEVSGGSCANTATGIASLGGRAGFIGKVQDDQLGEIFTHDLRSTGVHYTTTPASSGPGTAHCLVLVTPDAQRTMATFLGVAGGLSEADIDEDVVETALITFLEGYLIGLPTAETAVMKAIKVAREADRKVALTLSDPMWVSARRQAFSALLKDVDILLANEREACELTNESSAEGALSVLAQSCEVVAVTRGEHGALVTDGRQVAKVDAVPVASVVDTTGAGDLFAAGFLLGLARELDIADCARLGALCAAEVIGHIGARPELRLAIVARRFGLLT